MALLDLPVGIHQKISAIAVQHARPAAGERRRMRLVEPIARRFDAIDFDLPVIEEGMKQADGVRAAADAGEERIRQPPFRRLHLRARLLADDALEIAHHRRIGMRARRRADAIERVLDIGDPVAQRLVHRVLQRARAGLHRHHFRAEHVHAEDIRLLPLDIDRAHIDDAFEAEARAGGGRRDAMLAGAGLGDDARLAHAPREQDLAEHIVDLVRAGVVQLLALEIDFRAMLGVGGLAAQIVGQPLGEIERARTPDIIGEKIVEFGVKRRVLLRRLVMALEIEDQRHQRLGDETSAENAEMPALVGASAEGVRVFQLQCRSRVLDHAPAS